MDILEAILLGFVQGITEFIPVSSSGHLEIVQHLFGFDGEFFHLFLEFINIGTLLALLVYYRKRIFQILKNIFKERNYKLAINLIITTIPAGLAGLLLADFIESNSFFSALTTVAAAMGIMGIIMIFIDKIPHMSELKDENHLTPWRALFVGVMQVFALIPGTSRSGTTIVAGRIAGLSSESAADYSFLASIPLMCAVCLKLFVTGSSRWYFKQVWWPLLISNLVAFIIGLLALKFVLTYLKKPKSLQAFGRYRVILASIVLGVLLILA